MSYNHLRVLPILALTLISSATPALASLDPVLPSPNMDWPTVLAHALDAPVKKKGGPWLGDYVVDPERSAGASLESVIIRSAVLGHFTTTECPELLLLLTIIRTDRLPQISARAVIVRAKIVKGALSWSGTKYVLDDSPWFVGTVVPLGMHDADATTTNSVMVRACIQDSAGMLTSHRATLDFSRSPTLVEVADNSNECNDGTLFPALRRSRGGALSPILVGADEELRVRQRDSALQDTLSSTSGVHLSVWLDDEDTRKVVVDPSHADAVKKALERLGIGYTTADPASTYVRLADPDGTSRITRSTNFSIDRQALLNDK